MEVGWGRFELVGVNRFFYMSGSVLELQEVEHARTLFWVWTCCTFPLYTLWHTRSLACTHRLARTSMFSAAAGESFVCLFSAGHYEGCICGWLGTVCSMWTMSGTEFDGCFLVFSLFCHMSNEKNLGWLGQVIKGIILSSYIGIIINHFKDPS